MPTRRQFIQNSLLASASISELDFTGFSNEQNTNDSLPTWPLPHLKYFISEPVKIEAVELLITQGDLMLVVRANRQMSLWNCIGSVEIAVWDLLGKVAKKPVYELLGKQLRSEYPVYISDFNREGDPEKIANQLFEKLQATGATGVKIKVGGRMFNTVENATQSLWTARICLYS